VTEANTGDIAVKLKRDRSRASDEVISDVREKVNERYPALDVEYVQLLQDMIGDLTSVPEPIAIKLFSQDPALLRTWAPKVGAAIKKLPGVVDVLDGIENTISGPATLFRVDQAMAARAGFTPQEIELDISAMLQGEPAPTPVVLNDRPYTIRVRFPESTRSSVDPSRTRCWSAEPAGPVRSARSPRSRKFPARLKSAAKTCSATSRSRRGSRGSTSAPASPPSSARSPTFTCRRRFASSTAAPSPSSSVRFTT
jgi:hypothetical protein